MWWLDLRLTQSPPRGLTVLFTEERPPLRVEDGPFDGKFGASGLDQALESGLNVAAD